MSHSLPPLAALGVILAVVMISPGSAPPAEDIVVSEESIIPVSSGVSVTVYEQTGEVGEYTFLEDVLMTGGGTFSTLAIISEEFLVTSDGTYLTVSCERVPPEPLEGMATGNNVVAVKLNGVVGHPDGIWASTVVSYVIGTGGLEDSLANALGPADQLGPFMNSLCTYLGDYHSEITLAFETSVAEAIEATIDFDMDTFNLGSKGKVVQAYVELPDGYQVGEVVLSSVLLNGAVPALSHPFEIGDHDSDGVPDLMVKFDRAASGSTLHVGDEVLIVVSGFLTDGTPFEGADSIRVINPP